MLDIFPHGPSFDVREQLLDVAGCVVADIDGAACAAVNVADPNGEWSTLRTSADADALAVEQSEEEGPSLAAYLSGRVQHIRRTRSHHTWSGYCAACFQRGIHSVAAFPIMDGGTPLGVLTIGSIDYCGFGAHEIRLGLDGAARAGRIIANNRAAKNDRPNILQP
jgi:GAF domain-containing protein